MFRSINKDESDRTLVQSNRGQENHSLAARSSPVAILTYHLVLEMKFSWDTPIPLC